MRILVADDDDAIRRLLAAHLRASGHEVLEAGDGAAAVEVALRERPDAVLLDVLMPHLDGWGAIAKLRASGYGGRVAMVTALTGKVGAPPPGAPTPDAILPKPFRRADVEAMLARLVP